MNVQTIDINAWEWFDKINGNSYFAGNVIVNYGMDTQSIYQMPFQYGYGSQYEYEARNILEKAAIIANSDYSLGRYCRENGIILRSDIRRGCKKRELKEAIQ